MNSLTENISGVAHAIQLALAPVFLLTGIAGMLSVMTGRLSRIVDRGRTLTERPPAASDDRESLNRELASLERRRHFASVAITAWTIAALLVCMVIAALFLEVMLAAPLNWLIGSLFTGATLALIVGLSFFLREIHAATRSHRLPFPRREEIATSGAVCPEGRPNEMRDERSADKRA
jgi:hypothetical protein